ncbi:hypothetical protein OOK41_01330 [Micromonospora sp. NBC_01655]|uniref:hypothetical protein n=1 Tax=Micromonospora sp. NBC_01655 TaxID=2975983 RepID=UPI00224D0F84|nr:hypothetical protein [Micromonospora sp. NBC_01655]MCX4468966.1 hypothetical protein [Micromonospora sp. NBC_01655]
MAVHKLRNVRIFTGGADLTGQSNKVELGAEVEDKDTTNFGDVDANGDVWKSVIGGLGSAKVTAGGQWEAGDISLVDDDAWAALGGIGPWTIYPHESGPVGGAVGSVAWIVNGLRAQYALLGSPGDVAPWAASATSTWPLVRGVGLHAPGVPRTATGTGTTVQRPAVLAGQYVYASLHVLSVAGTGTPTLTVTVQSAADAGFTTPTDRATFTAATARTGQALRVAAGPITDTYWRLSWTITGTAPSFLFAAAVGIK